MKHGILRILSRKKQKCPTRTISSMSGSMSTYIHQAASTFLHDWFKETIRSLEAASGLVFTTTGTGAGARTGDTPSTSSSTIAIQQLIQNHTNNPLILAHVSISEKKEVSFITAKRHIRQTKLVLLIDIQEDETEHGHGQTHERDSPNPNSNPNPKQSSEFSIYVSLWRQQVPPQCVFAGTLSFSSENRVTIRPGEVKSNAISFMMGELLPGLCHFDDDPIQFSLGEFLRYLHSSLSLSG